MATVQQIETKRVPLTDNGPRDEMNNEISSTSSENSASDPVTKFNNFYRAPYVQSQSDNEGAPRRSVISRNHYKSTGNINDIYTEVTLQNSVSSVDLDLRGGEVKKFDALRIPIVGYEVMEERARFTIYKLKVTLQNSVSSVDLDLRGGEVKKFDALRIPIVGYEVMEERARFTIYKLKVEDDKRDQSWLVFRRYTDFVRLYNRVKNQQPNLMLPLPGKRWFRDNFEPAFLEERVRGLQIFVNAILSKLPNHPLVREFFCLDEPPQVFSYQPEVQAVYGALEDSISTLKMQLKQKDATIMHLQKRVAVLEDQVKNCPTCCTNKSANI